MRVPSSTGSCSHLLLPALLAGLGLLVAVTGCSKGDREGGKEERPTTGTPSLENVEKPSTPSEVAKPEKPLADEPPLVARPTAEFMGTRVVGRRFCIIADASNSMRGAPLAQLKKEILKTLEGLGPDSQFYIMFFNATDIPMPSPSWLDANKENVAKVKPWVENMTTLLKTLPQSAFTRAFKLEPKPDVIFFMTDGFLQGRNPDPVTHVCRLNTGNPKVAVHTIMFSKLKPGAPKAAAAAEQLRGMAEKNGGTFRHVNQQ